MKNLEIKVKVENLEEIKNLLSFALYQGMLKQKDTYFLLGETKLKLREEKIGSEIILYVRKTKEGVRESNYYRVTIIKSLVPVIKNILSFILGIKVIVDKKRELYIYKNTRIHLDEVVGFGRFVELETVCKNSLEENKYIEEFNEVKNKLFLDKYESIGGSYSDLLKSKK